jgi:type VI secretion system protein ImpF
MNGRPDRDQRVEQSRQVRLPLLDRLIDDSPDAPREAPLSEIDALNRLRRSVRRDLEALLNARRRWRSWPDAYRELAASPVGYGLADFTAGAFNEAAQREHLRAQIEQTIRRFEPRLDRVRVVLVDAENNTLDTTLRLRIEALLRVEPGPEPIAFDTLIDAGTAEVQIKSGSTAGIASNG